MAPTWAGPGLFLLLCAAPLMEVTLLLSCNLPGPLLPLTVNLFQIFVTQTKNFRKCIKSRESTGI